MLEGVGGSAKAKVGWEGRRKGRQVGGPVDRLLEEEEERERGRDGREGQTVRVSGPARRHSHAHPPTPPRPGTVPSSLPPYRPSTAEKKPLHLSKILNFPAEH